jgi:hypothetical protein
MTTVDVETLRTNFGTEVRRARTETLLQFREHLENEIAAHPDRRDEILAATLEALREFRTQYRDVGNEPMEDITLDLMDLVTGWVGEPARV